MKPITTIEELESLRDGDTINTNGRSIQLTGNLVFDEATHILTRGGNIHIRGRSINTNGGDVHTHGGDIRTDGGDIDTNGGAIDDNIPPPIEDQIKLLDEIRARVLAHPECLNMSNWHCGSSHCLAGHAQVIKEDKGTGGAYEAGIKYIPLALHMFFEEDDRVLRWLENREYAMGHPRSKTTSTRPAPSL